VRWLVAVVAIGCSSSASQPAATAPPAKPPSPAKPAIPATLSARLPALDRMLSEARAKLKLPGLIAAVITRDGVTWTKAYGERDPSTHAPVTSDTRFRLGSITKVITALAVLKLRDAGKLDLDAPASRWIPELASVVPATRDSPPITLRHLMTHTSGLPREPQIPDPYGVTHEVTEAEVIGSLHTTHLDTATGTTESYSNLGAALEGLIVARASGQPYAAYTEAEILRPLGMTTATFDRAAIPAGMLAVSFNSEHGRLVPSHQLHEGATAARGQLYATIGDLEQLARAELLAWPPRDDPDTGPVRRSTLRESQRAEGPARPGPSMKGAAWFLSATSKGLIVEHGGTGEGFTCDVWLAPSANVAFAIMVDVEGAEPIDMAAEARSILLPDLPNPVELAAALLDDASDANAARLVDAKYLKGMRDRGSLATFGRMRTALGACTATGSPEVDGELTKGVVTCGSTRFAVKATASDAGQLTLLRVDPWSSETQPSPPSPPPPDPTPAGK
jgi:CubicO group peptidase (beta-lactamase class C family)